MQVKDVVSVMLVRMLPPLCLAALSTITLTQYIGWSAQRTLSLITPLLLFSLAPISIQSKQFAHEFRLNESLVAASWRASCWLSLCMSVVIAAVSVVAGGVGDAGMFVYALYGLVVMLLAWGNVQINSGSDSSSKKEVKSNEYQERPPAGKVRMVYAGVPSSDDVSGGNQVVIDDDSSSGGGGGGGGGVDDEKQQWQQQQRGKGPSAIGQRRSVLRTTVCRPVYRPMRSIRRGIQPLECRIRIVRIV